MEEEQGYPAIFYAMLIMRSWIKRAWTICPVCGIIVDRFGRCGCNTCTPK